MRLPVRAAAALCRGARAAEGGRASSIPASAPAPRSPPRSPPAPRRRTGRTGPSIPAPAAASAERRRWRGRMPGGSTSPRRWRGPGRSTGWTIDTEVAGRARAVRRRRPRPQGRAGQLPSRRHGRRCRAGRHRRRARPRPVRLHPCPPAAPGAARPADAASIIITLCSPTPRASASPSATARRPSPTCARPAPIRRRWSTALRRGRIAGWIFARRRRREARMQTVLIILHRPRRAGATLFVLVKGVIGMAQRQGHHRPALAGADAQARHVPGDRDPARRRCCC